MAHNFADQSTSQRESRAPLGPALLTLGIAGDWLIRGEGAGLNVALWVAAVVCTWHWLRVRAGVRPADLERALLITALGLAGGWLWRENPMLRFLDSVALALVFALLPLAAAPEAVTFARLSSVRVMKAAMRLARRGMVGWLPPLLEPRPPRSTDRASVLGAVTRGSLLAVPCLLVFGSLLGSADQVFGDFLMSLVRVDVEQIANHTLPALGITWLAAALLLGADPREGSAVLETRPARGPVFGPIEVGMTLGMLDLLFAAFVAFQLPYLFGGLAWVERTAGITLAEYARRGFFELVLVSALVLPLLLVLDARVEVGRGTARRLFRSLAGIKIALLLVIIGSALHRMTVYQHEFGLTEDRVFATAFIGGTAVTCCWFGVTALRGSGARFAPGALLGWGVWLALLHAINPEQVIVATNIRRAAAGRPLDVTYLTGLSADAVPALIASLSNLSDADRGTVTLRLASREDPRATDLRGWSLARRRAREALTELPAQPNENRP